MMRDLTRRTRRAQADHLRRGRELPQALPPSDAEAAQMAARGGASLAASERSYRIGHAAAWSAWLDAIESLGLDGATLRECVRVVSGFVIAYDDRILELFRQEYERASERELRTGRNRMPLIRDLVDGLTDSPAGLDYELGAEHLAVVASGAEGSSSLVRLAATLDRQLLAGAVTDRLTWGWLGAGGSPDRADDRARIDGFVPPPGCSLALGQPLRGLDGFRRSHRQAGEAHLVALRTRAPLTFYADVAVEAMALGDERVARDFVLSQLGPLDEGARSSELRETLRTYFASAQNAAATAASLGVHEQTVARRLRTVESRIGAAINSRRVELELALRLERLLGASRDPSQDA